MDNPTNLTPLYHYAENFAQAVCQDYFKQKKQIRGKEIVKLTHIQQVNLMTVKLLFDKWQEEASSIRSPYFNYKEADVKQAFNKLMNLLSKNIEIEQAHFEPLLRSAAEQTLLLLLYPEDFFKGFFATLPARVSYQRNIAPNFKYLKLHERLLEKIKKKLDLKSQEIDNSEALATVLAVVQENKDQLDTPYDTLNALSDIVPVGLYELAPDWEGGHNPLEEAEDPNDFLSQFDLDEGNKAEHFNDEQKLDKIEEESDLREHDFLASQKASQSQNILDAEEREASMASAKQEKKGGEKEEEKQRQGVDTKITGKNERDQGNQPLADPKPEKDEPKENDGELQRLQQKSSERKSNRPNVSIASKLAAQLGRGTDEKTDEQRRQKLAQLKGESNTNSLKSSLNLNQKFKFLNELFGGNKADFDHAIETIDQSPDYHSALDKIKTKYWHKYKWDLGKEATVEFMSLVDKVKG